MTVGISPIDRSIMKFMTVQLFALIYFQKLAVPGIILGPHMSQINVSMLVMVVGLLWMLVTAKIDFSPVRFGCYLVFVAFCLISQILVSSMGSVASIVELFVLCLYMTVTAELPEIAYKQVLDRFIKLMIVPALIILCQYAVQKATGQRDPISMDHLFAQPKTSSLLYQGYFYEAGYPVWNAPFTRPNGFFFLEPSFASMFTAAATIIEITYFRRGWLVVLMALSTVLTLGGTGMTMFLVAGPFLLAREQPKLIVVCLGLVVVGVLTALALDIPLPLMDRMGELTGHETSAGPASSGADRLSVPANQLVTMLFDRTHVLGGIGAGATPQDFSEFGSAWPVLKLINEYGLLAMGAFIFLYTCAIWGEFNVPLKLALTVIYQFTGGYLLSPVTLEIIVLLCCVMAPIPYRVAQTDPSRALVLLPSRTKSGHGSARPLLLR